MDKGRRGLTVIGLLILFFIALYTVYTVRQMNIEQERIKVCTNTYESDLNMNEEFAKELCTCLVDNSFFTVDSVDQLEKIANMCVNKVLEDK